MSMLVIMRHAEAAPSKVDDHARPLTPRGRADAIALGRSLQGKLGMSPTVLASDAARTMETAELAFSAFPGPLSLHRLSELYAATPEILLRAIQMAPGNADVVVLVGHNPGVSQLADQLGAGASEADRASLTAGLPTAGAALFAVDEPWSSVDRGKARLLELLLSAGIP